MEIETNPLRAFARRAFSARLGAVLMLAPAALFSACGGVNPTDDMGAPAESAAEPLLADPDCSVIEAQLSGAERRIDQILEELQTAPPGSEHSELLRQLRLWTSRAAQLRRSLDRCRNPPPPPLSHNVLPTGRAVLRSREDVRAPTNAFRRAVFADSPVGPADPFASRRLIAH